MPDNQYSYGTGQTGVFPTHSDNDVRQEPAIERALRKIRPDKRPFTMLLETTGAPQSVGQMEWTWQEQWPIQSVATVNATSTPSDTTINVDDASFIVEHHAVRVQRTGEMMYVTSVNRTSNVLTVVRGIGLSNQRAEAAALVSGDILNVVATAAQEAQDKPELLSRGTQDKTLYIQQIIHGTGLSDWQSKSEKRGPQEKIRLSEQAGEYFNDMRERNLLLGVPDKEAGANTGYYTYFAAGLDWYARYMGVRTSLNGVLTYPGLCGAVQRIGRFASDKVMYGFTGLTVLNRVNNLRDFKSAVRTVPSAEKWGWDVREIVVPGGKSLRLIRSHVLEESGLDDQIICTELSALKRKTFKGQGSVDLRRGIQSNGAYRDEWSLSVYEALDHRNVHGCGLIEHAA